MGLKPLKAKYLYQLFQDNVCRHVFLLCRSPTYLIMNVVEWHVHVYSKNFLNCIFVLHLTESNGSRSITHNRHTDLTLVKSIFITPFINLSGNDKRCYIFINKLVDVFIIKLFYRFFELIIETTVPWDLFI